MPPATDYKVQVEVFEGPLDLLLYLIRRDEVDIYNIPIERITRQYMEYLGLMRMLDLAIAGEFLVMAATLMLIKSRMLLPEDQRPEIEGEEEGEDPRWDLVRQLVEYKKFKDAALHLQGLEEAREDVFALGAPGIGEPEEPGLGLRDVSLFDLISAFGEVLKRAREEQIGEIAAETYTVADKIEAILRLVRAGATLPFSALFGAGAHRHEVICTFLALLELIRLRQVEAAQTSPFEEITLRATEGAVAAGAVPEEEAHAGRNE